MSAFRSDKPALLAAKADSILFPSFDIFEMEDEIEFIFKQTYNEFLKGNKKYLEKVCGEVAMALFNAELKRRETGVINAHI
jgi:hypothetical protein